VSADNWTVCPKCKQSALEAKSKAQQTADESYGKVTPAEWLALKAKADIDPAIEDTLREDYGLGIRDGEFHVNYCASCQCGFSFKYKYTKPVD